MKFSKEKINQRIANWILYLSFEGATFGFTHKCTAINLNSFGFSWVFSDDQLHEYNDEYVNTIKAYLRETYDLS